MNHKYETLGVVSLFASEIFLVHPNISTGKYPWALLIIAWIVYAIVVGYVADRLYNRFYQNNELARYLSLMALAIGIFGITYLIGRLAF